jgi:hypothetical protein
VITMAPDDHTRPGETGHRLHLSGTKVFVHKSHLQHLTLHNNLPHDIVDVLAAASHVVDVCHCGDVVAPEQDCTSCQVGSERPQRL